MLNYFKKRIPSRSDLLARSNIISKNRSSFIWYNFITNRLQDESLWSYNKKSVSKAVVIGIITAFIPLPCQMFIASCLSIIMNSNLPISISLVWITNPITMPPIYYFCYKLGTYTLNYPTLRTIPSNSIIDWLWAQSNIILKPFLLGSLVIGLTTAIISYFLVIIFYDKLKK